VGRRTVDVEVVLLDIFALVSLAVGQAKHTLLEYGILAVPQSKGKAQTLLVVAEASDAILAPVIGARARLIVGKVAPSVAVLAVVLPDGSPLALAEIGPPQLPGGSGVPALLEAQLFRRPSVIDDWRLGHPRLLPSPRPCNRTRPGLLFRIPQRRRGCSRNLSEVAGSQSNCHEVRASRFWRAVLSGVRRPETGPARARRLAARVETLFSATQPEAEGDRVDSEQFADASSTTSMRPSHHQYMAASRLRRIGFVSLRLSARGA
jgi:hypothetical protein